jgi:hypothetical protein
MLVFKPTVLDEAALNDLVADSEKPSHFWLVDCGCPTLRRGQVLTHSELMNMCRPEVQSSAKASKLPESIAISE